MAKIELNSYDLQIKDIKNEDGTTSEVVQIRSQIAFDEDFIEEMKLSGVRKIELRQDNGESGE